MLNLLEYELFMSELDRITKWRKEVIKKFPKDKHGAINTSDDITIPINVFLKMVRELDDIELNLRKFVISTSPDLKTIFGTPFNH